MTTTSDH